MFTQRRNTSSHERVKWKRVDFSNWHDKLLQIKSNLSLDRRPCQTIDETEMQIHLCSSSLHSNDENHRSTRPAGGTERGKMNYIAEEFICQPTQCQRFPFFLLFPFPPTSFTMSTCLINSLGLRSSSTRSRPQLMHNSNQTTAENTVKREFGWIVIHSSTQIESRWTRERLIRHCWLSWEGEFYQHATD